MKQRTKRKRLDGPTGQPEKTKDDFLPMLKYTVRRLHGNGVSFPCAYPSILADIQKP